MQYWSPMKNRLLRLVGLACGVLLILFSLFLLSRHEVFHHFYGGSDDPFDYNYGVIILVLIGAVFFLGLTLTVASYYHHKETHLAVKNESITIQ